jgi:N-acetylglutamate synthase-like GNAT family acetyltransferase
MPSSPEPVAIRTTLRPGDLGSIVHLHGVIHGQECGFDATFEAYVAAPLAEFVRRMPTDGERIWIAERDGRIVGCIAIVAASPEDAQLRWFLVEPQARRLGLGTRLLHEAIMFCKEHGFRRIFLWTVDVLTAAARLYSNAGFQLVEERPGRCWGVDVIEQRYELVMH